MYIRGTAFDTGYFRQVSYAGSQGLVGGQRLCGVCIQERGAMINNIKSRIAVFAAAFSIWLLLDWAPDWQHILAGAAVALFTTYIAGDMFSVRLDIVTYPRKLAGILNYAAVFIWEMLKANLDVAYRVAHPDLAMSPGIMKIKISLKSEMAIALLANSVTLASRTLTVDADPEKGFLYVHCMDIKGKNTDLSAVKVTERFENILKRIFE
jgi:multicomponent Na+:H+ antiporter subunit E